MVFKRGGLIFNPKGKFGWAESYALQPTPLLSDEGILVYCGFRDKTGISRVGRVLLNKEDPREVIDYSKEPVLNIGEDGCFDDNGVVPCFVKKHGGKIYMYYAGYQLVKKIKFQVFGGLAVSDDGGLTFRRQSKVPYTDRTCAEPFFRVIHSVINNNNRYYYYYGGGGSFINIGDKVFPSYNIRCFESEDFNGSCGPSKVVIDFESNDEYRVARPYVFYEKNQLAMLYYSSKKDGTFSLKKAVSSDGHAWRQSMLAIENTKQDWDSQMMAYPSYVRTSNFEYIFYNGNNYGEEGFGFLYRGL